MAYPHARRKYTIVGIDPGTTIGIAIIDLNGKPVEVFSAKNYSISDAVARIISHGSPLIVASDVTPTPAMVKKIGSMFAAPGHDLDESLSTEEKIALTKGEGYEYKNAHERDALAACVNAFKHYKKKFAQVQKKTPAGVNAEEVKALVVKGVSISAAISRLINAEEERKKVTEEERREEKKSNEEKESKIILRLRGLLKGKDEKIELLEERTTTLKASLNEKEREVRSLKRKLGSMRSERTREIKRAEVIRKRDIEIERLIEEVRAIENENAELRRVIAGLKGKREVKGGKKIKVIQSFSHDAILDMDRKYGLNKGDIVFLVDGSGGGASTAELLAKKGVAAVIYSKELSHFAADKFFEFGIPSFSTDEIPLLLKEEEDEGDFAFVDRHLLNESIEEWNRERQSKKVILLR
jgi:predicted RNase H-like nuclease (RuvC/YqgF family)